MLQAALLLWLAADVSLQPGTARPGDAVLVTVRQVDEAPTGSIGSWALTFLPIEGGFEALLPLSIEAKPGEYELTVDFGHGRDKTFMTGTLEVLAANFRKSELTVSKKFTNISKKDQQHSARDQLAFNEAFDVDFEPWLFSGNFDWPRPKEITAPFGDRRMFNGKQKSQHYGTDLDGATGDPIYAANDGEVVMVRDCFGSGNTVMVHHGGRLFTAYFHMSKFEVVNGVTVKRGQLLGRVGKTGRVTGPHLHFGAKLDGRWVNPESLLALDFGLEGVAAASPAPSLQ